MTVAGVDILFDVIYRLLGREPTRTHKAESSPGVQGLGESGLVVGLGLDELGINDVRSFRPRLGPEAVVAFWPRNLVVVTHICLGSGAQVER